MPKKLNSAEHEELLTTLQARFEKHMHRHEGVKWEQVRQKLERAPDKLWSLQQMELTGGEPDVVTLDESSAIVFVDCAAESPKGRRSLCYDQAALDTRKQNKPEGSAVGRAESMGAALLTEQEYRRLQQFGEFDAKTSSWIDTTPGVRKLGGAMFGDYRFGTVWIYHNGADSYYAARGFRCALRL